MFNLIKIRYKPLIHNSEAILQERDVNNVGTKLQKKSNKIDKS